MQSGRGVAIAAVNHSPSPICDTRATNPQIGYNLTPRGTLFATARRQSESVRRSLGRRDKRSKDTNRICAGLELTLARLSAKVRNLLRTTNGGPQQVPLDVLGCGDEWFWEGCWDDRPVAASPRATAVGRAIPVSRNRIPLRCAHEQTADLHGFVDRLLRGNHGRDPMSQQPAYPGRPHGHSWFHLGSSGSKETTHLN
jgi:hypothetical protein